MSNILELKKGESLIQENDNLSAVYILKTGRLTCFLERNEKKIELQDIRAGQIVGEEALVRKGRSPFTVVAATPCKVFVMPVQVLKAHLESAAPTSQFILKGLAEALKDLRGVVRSIKMEQDSSPCPDKFIPKTFGFISIATKEMGKELVKKEKKPHLRTAEDDGAEFRPGLSVQWGPMKLWGNRIFMESPLRVQGAMEILQKLGYLKMVYVQSEEDENEEELSEIHVYDNQFIYDFSDFYQYHYYKPGISEILKTDDVAMKIMKGLSTLGEGVEKDHKGSTIIDFDEFCTHMKENFSIKIKPMHLSLLEKKGLFTQKKPNGDKVSLIYDHSEIFNTFRFWQILKEVKKWNINGVVDNKLDVLEAQIVSASGECPDCKAAISEKAKFCSECGYKIAA